MFEGVDRPLRLKVGGLKYFYELDLAGNVRRLRRPDGSDAGGYRYSAFGTQYAGPAPAVDQPLRWKGRWWSDFGGVYDVRARQWSPALGAFTSVDEFVFHDARSTLWGWPNQNPLAFDDPSGRLTAGRRGDPLGDFLRSAANFLFSESADHFKSASADLHGREYGKAATNAAFGVGLAALASTADVLRYSLPYAELGIGIAMGMEEDCPPGARSPKSGTVVGLGSKDAKILQAAQEAAGGPGSFARDLGALAETVGQAVPGGQVHLLGEIDGAPVYGSLVSRVGIADVGGVTQVVRVPLGGTPEIVGPFHP